MNALHRRQSLKLGGLAMLTPLLLKPIAASASSDVGTALDVVTQDPRFSDWARVLTVSGQSQYTGSTQKFTAFFPTNNAFALYPHVLMAALKPHSRAFPDMAAQVDFVRSHVLYDIHPLSECAGRVVNLTAISGFTITVDGTTSGIYTVTWQSIGGKTAKAQFTDTPIQASNALIYAFDSVVVS